MLLADTQNIHCQFGNRRHTPSMWDQLGSIRSACTSDNFLTKSLYLDAGTSNTIITGSITEFYALRLVFLSLVVKIILTTNFVENEAMDVDGKEDIKDSDFGSLVALVRILNVQLGGVRGSELWKKNQRGHFAIIPTLLLFILPLCD